MAGRSPSATRSTRPPTVTTTRAKASHPRLPPRYSPRTRSTTTRTPRWMPHTDARTDPRSFAATGPDVGSTGDQGHLVAASMVGAEDQLTTAAQDDLDYGASSAAVT